MNTEEKINIEQFKNKLLEVKEKLDKKKDEIPLDARPKMLDFDYDKDSYIIVSYSRKDFVEVYLFLAHLYNEGYRFWYDNGMKGTEKWLKEYKDKFENPNCLGTITFFSDNYISDSTKEELSIIYQDGKYIKKNDMISLIALDNIDANKMLKTAINNDRISIENAANVMPILSDIIEEEKQKTIHRYNDESDVAYLVEKVGNDFNIQSTLNCKKAINQAEENSSSGFIIEKGVLIKYIGNDIHIIIPDGVTRIAEEVFCERCDIESVYIPYGVTSIGYKAFKNCSELTSIEIPNSVKSIGDQTFFGCRNIANIAIPSSVENIGNSAFKNCRIKSFTMSRNAKYASRADRKRIFGDENICTRKIFYFVD